MKLKSWECFIGLLNKYFETALVALVQSQICGKDTNCETNIICFNDGLMGRKNVWLWLSLWPIVMLGINSEKFFCRRR